MPNETATYSRIDFLVPNGTSTTIDVECHAHAVNNSGTFMSPSHEINPTISSPFSSEVTSTNSDIVVLQRGILQSETTNNLLGRRAQNTLDENGELRIKRNTTVGSLLSED